ncbi:MAG: type II toxin-antitoxin system Phd/YefM family antitoxin [bacterium]
MGIKSSDIVPLGQVRSRLTELSEEARGGAEKIITRNGEAYVALVDACRRDHYHRLEREHLHLTLLDDVARGWSDVVAGRVLSVAEARARFGKRPATPERGRRTKRR